jgi:hypothetical protein
MANKKLADCFCQLAVYLGDAKSAFLGVLDTTIGVLTALKAMIQLFNINIEDEARKIAYQTLLDLMKQPVATIELPFNIVLGYTKELSDCDPVNSFSRTIKNVRDEILKPVKDFEYEIQQYIAALEDKKRKIDLLDRWINTLQTAKEALELCGTS